MTAPYRNVAARELERPARHVPTEVKRRLYLGGRMAIVAWVFIIVGSIFEWVMVPNADLSALTISGPYAMVRGEVAKVEPSAFREGSATTRRVDFLVGQDGRYFVGSSYTRSKPPEVGAPVDIEVPRGRLEDARIVGMRREPMPAWAVLVLLPLLLTGVGLLIARFRRASREVHLLARGRLGSARLVRREETRMYVDGKQVHKLSFDYEDDSSRVHRLIVRSYELERVVDDKVEPILFDPDAPERAALVDALPGARGIDPQGQLRFDNGGGPLSLVGLPAAAALVNLVGLLVVALS